MNIKDLIKQDTKQRLKGQIRYACDEALEHQKLAKLIPFTNIAEHRIRDEAYPTLAEAKPAFKPNQEATFPQAGRFKDSHCLYSGYSLNLSAVDFNNVFKSPNKIRSFDKQFIRDKVGETFFDPGHATDELVDECFAIVNDRSRVLRILAIAKSAIRHNMAADLPNMKQPSCLIWGRNDTITPPEVAGEFQALLPDADLHWIDQCGHAPMMEHPEEFNSILSDWYERRGILS